MSFHPSQASLKRPHSDIVMALGRQASSHDGRKKYLRDHRRAAGVRRVLALRNSHRVRVSRFEVRGSTRRNLST